jgi:hypothetical protein
VRRFRLAFSIDLITRRLAPATSMRAFGLLGTPRRKVVLWILVFVMPEPSGALDSLVGLHIHQFGQPQYRRSVAPGLLPQQAMPMERGDSACDSP